MAASRRDLDQNHDTGTALNVTQAWYDWYVAATPETLRTKSISVRSTHSVEASAAPRGRGPTSPRKVRNSIHPDQHCLTFSPNNPQIIYAGSDGGIFRSAK